MKNSAYTLIKSYSNFSFSFQIYKISTMWYYPLSCLICFLIGALVSALIKPQDPKVLNRDLISPAFYTLFRWFPFLAYLIGQEKDFEAEIGIDYVSLAPFISMQLFLECYLISIVILYTFNIFIFLPYF